MKTILVVEDSEDDVFFLKRALKGSGLKHPLQIVSDGQQAIDYLAGEGAFGDRALYPVPGLVLLDLKLPYVMGFDVLRWLRARAEYRTLFVVILTSSQEEVDMKTARELGSNLYLTKPPTRDQLAAMVVELADMMSE